MVASEDRPAAPPRPVVAISTSRIAERLADRERLLALRAERLARLKPPAPVATPVAAPPRIDARDEGTLAAFLGAALAAGGEGAPRPLAEPPAAQQPAAEVLHFHRPGAPAPEPPARPAAAPPPPASDLDRLPGVGPGLAWALGRAGIGRRADLAGLEADDLARRLGPIGRLVPAAAWIAAARAEAAETA